jgi:hypothetical protein
MSDPLMDIADRGELAPDVELRAYWGAFCDCDPSPDDFGDRMEHAGLIVLEGVSEDDLDEAFAAERGIVPGGLIWRLTKAGDAAMRDEGKAPLARSEDRP